MARYMDEYGGTRTGPGGARGLDPNFRGGYRGDRQAYGRGQAPYGWYRQQHVASLGGAEPYGYEWSPRRDPRSGPIRYDEFMRGGGAVYPPGDPRLVRQYNRNSPALRPGGEPGRALPARRERAFPEPYDPGPRFGYGNRGLSSSGYSEGWARGPMPGAR